MGSEQIAEDPTLLGLGDLALRDKEMDATSCRTA